MKKFLSIFLTIILLTLALCSCSSNNSNKDTASNEKPKEESVKANITGLKGPTSIGMIQLFEENPSLGDNIQCEYDIANSPDLLNGKLFNEEIDIAALPTNVASVIYNKTNGKYKLAAVNTLGVLYVVSKNDIKLDSFKDLEGKKINMSGKGSVPDFAFKYLLDKNNITADLDYSLDHSNLAQAVIAGDIDIALLPQPFVTMVTMKNKNTKIALSIQDEWKKIEGDKSTLAMGCIVVKDEFAKSHPEAVNTFLKEYEKSVDWVNSNPKDASLLVEKFKILPAAKMAELAIPKCNIVFMNSKDSKELLNEFFKLLYDFNPKALGGNLPDDNFYYEE